MKRRLFTILSAISLLLCLATLPLICLQVSGDDWLTLSHLKLDENETFYFKMVAHAGRFNCDLHDYRPKPSGRRRAGDLDFLVLGYDYSVNPGPYGSAHYHIQVQYWLAALLFAIPPAIQLRTILRTRKRTRFGLCQTCGYDLRASKERCAECGMAIVGNDGH